MKVIGCELCGSNDLIKQDGIFVCQNCGTKYTAEEAKKLFINSAASVEENRSSELDDIIKNPEATHEDKNYNIKQDQGESLNDVDDILLLHSEKVCPECGRKVFDDVRICSYCGFELNIDEKLDALSNKKKAIIGRVIISSIFLALIIALSITVFHIRKKQTKELVSTIENSFNNRVYVNTGMDEMDKAKIQRDELQSYSESHKILLISRELKSIYQNLIEQIDNQITILAKEDEIGWGRELEELEREHSAIQSEVSDDFMLLVTDYDMCSNNKPLAERFSLNQKLFRATNRAREDLASIDMETRKKILSGGSIIIQNNTDFKEYCSVVVTGTTGDEILAGGELEIPAWESKTISKIDIPGGKTAGDVFFLVYLEDPRW